MEKNHPNVSVTLLLLFICVGTEGGLAQNTTISVKVGVILDLNTLVGRTGLSCIKMALSDFHGTGLVLHVRDSRNDVVAAAAAALDLIKNEQVHAILGPQCSTHASFVIELGKKAQVPIITFSATSPSLTSVTNPYFIRATQASSSQVKAIGAIVQAFEWRQAVPIYVDNEYGEGIIPYLVDALHEVDAHIPYRSVMSVAASDDEILKELYKLMTMQTRVFIVHMLPPLSSRLFSKAHEIGMMSEDYVWIMTSDITQLLRSLDSSVFNSMQGVIGVAPYVPPTKELNTFNARWKSKFPNITESELSTYGLWAYDAARALAMAVEGVSSANFGFQMITNVSTQSTDLEKIGISQIGPQLHRSLASTRFTGLAGHFHLVNMELQQPAFEIVNIVGNVQRSIGFWTPKNGLVQKMNSLKSSYSTSKSNLRQVVWPGYVTSTPKGWQVPTNGNRLRIAVPVTFKEFVDVSYDPTTKRRKVSGYCIDVFDAVMKALPYDVGYDYFPFENKDGTSAGTYNDLIDQVYLKKYDAVVGDVTILANRSEYVDFTLPYTESGVSMIVPIKDKRDKGTWVFLKPLTWDLWVATLCFFIFIGFAVWVLEHRINEDFRGPPSYQVGTSFWFSFSTMVFAHRERVVSNLGRFVVIIWAFVVLILTQSYTASFTTMLTVQQLKPTVTDLNELVRRGENVGYLEGSFVLDVLKKYKFDESKLKMYNSIEECDRLLSLGSAKGGIGAAVDEIPYMRLLLSKHCSKYTKVQQIYKADGFGFAFPKGSPLVLDISRAILNVTEGSEMEKIERHWLGEEGSCQELSASLSTYSLGLDSFWGLFLIVGVAASMALIVYMVMFIYEQTKEMNTDAPLWTRMKMLLRTFDEKDKMSHTFRNSQVQGEEMSIPQGSEPSTHPSPCSYSSGADSNIELIAHPSRIDEASEEEMASATEVRCIQISS